jgi:DNA invertase Pin-like site-specific DNA recombinase
VTKKHATPCKFITHILAALTEYDLDLICQRTREALAALKARGRDVEEA